MVGSGYRVERLWVIGLDVEFKVFFEQRGPHAAPKQVQTPNPEVQSLYSHI